MAKFQGYFQGWARCTVCGVRLVKVGDQFWQLKRHPRHRPGQKKGHDLVIRKREEARLLAERYAS